MRRRSLSGNHDVAGGAELNFFQRVSQVTLEYFGPAAPGREQRRLVHQIREVGAGHAGGRRREFVQVDLVGERNLAGMDPQNVGAALVVWRMDDDRPVEPTGPQQRRVEDVRTVRGRQHDHPFRAGEAVHLGQDLVQGLFALVVTAERIRAARPADGVDLVDEDDRRGDLAGLGKQFADAAGANADDHLDEL